MNNGTRKISIRLDSSLHDKLQELVKIHPHHSMTAVIEKLITAGLSDGSTAKAHIYLEAAVANLAAMLDLLSRDPRVKPEGVQLQSYIYGRLIEMIIDIAGVEE